MLKADFLDDYYSMMDEILAFDQKPEIRIQGRDQGIKHYPEGPRMVEATVVLTHWDSRNQIIREAIIFVGEVGG